MKNLLPLLALLVPTGALAQQAGTPEAAIEALTASKGPPTETALAILRQKSGAISKTGVDAFADELARIFRDGEDGASYFAGMALRQSAELYGGGVPYERAKDILISVYESFEDPNHRRARRALLLVYQAGAEDYVRNLFEASEQPPPCTYPPQIFFEGEESVEVENPCPNKGTWCTAGRVLVTYDEGPVLSLWGALCAHRRY